MRNARQLLKQNKPRGGNKCFGNSMSVVALSSVPVLSFGIAQVATSGNAFAAGKSTTCSGGAQTVTFAAPGPVDLGERPEEQELDRQHVCGVVDHVHRSQARFRHRRREQHHDHKHDEVQQGFEPAGRMHGQPEVLGLRLGCSVRHRRQHPVQGRADHDIHGQRHDVQDCQHEVRPGHHVPEH